VTHGTESISLSYYALTVNISLTLAAAIYVRGWFLVRIIFPMRFHIYRLAAFIAGILCVGIAIGSPVESSVHLSLTFHMVQHLLLMACAPPLILLGSPALPLLRGLPQSIAQHILIPFLSRPSMKRIGRIITHPVICWLGASLALVLWHVPAIFEQAMRWQWLHAIERVSFLATGLLFWWPVIQPWPSTARWPRWSVPLYLFCATLPCDALSAFLVFCDRVVYTSYLHAPRALNFSPFQDQDFAAALMWVTETVILLVPAVLITFKLLSPLTSRLPSRHTDDTSTPFLTPRLYSRR